jgi:hypothetical protein
MTSGGDGTTPDWAHTFRADLEHCPRCGGPMRWAEVATGEAALALLIEHGLPRGPLRSCAHRRSVSSNFRTPADGGGAGAGQCERGTRKHACRAFQGPAPVERPASTALHMRPPAPARRAKVPASLYRCLEPRFCRLSYRRARPPAARQPAVGNAMPAQATRQDHRNTASIVLRTHPETTADTG